MRPLCEREVPLTHRLLAICLLEMRREKGSLSPSLRFLRPTSELGLVSRSVAGPNGCANFIGDEGRSFGFSDQVADPKPPRAALVKSHGGERCGNVGTMIPAGTVERGERKRTVDEVSKAD